jgi:hypothetical protein
MQIAYSLTDVSKRNIISELCKLQTKLKSTSVLICQGNYIRNKQTNICSSFWEFKKFDNFRIIKEERTVEGEGVVQGMGGGGHC